MPRFGQNIFSSRLFADLEPAAFGYDAFTRLAASQSRRRGSSASTPGRSPGRPAERS